jgi:aspartyl-tRNA(Asn)/glutamyl-tRNA(Gln) amidotransferase subunit A
MQPTPAGEADSTADASPQGTALAGIPVAVKDLFETTGVLTTSGSLFFRDYVPDSDAAVVRRLKAAGARIIGKTNTHEIAFGVTTANPHFGACRNPWDDSRIPGGSSGGSAVAVATGMALAATGTDTGGSIRIPAALCGVVGLKPTFGRVGMGGVLPLSRNLDHAGPLARTVRDAALLLRATAGHDPTDPYSASVPVDDYLVALEGGVAGWNVGLAAGEYADRADDEVLEAVHNAAAVLETCGANITTLDVSYLREAAFSNGVMMQADAAAYHHERLERHPDWFGEDVRERLEAGRATTSAEYVLARQTQVEMKHRLGKLLEIYDLLLLPSTPSTAPTLALGNAPGNAPRLTRFTAPFNLTGLPAISVPCGFSDAGMPIGVQLVAGAWKEAKLLRAARTYEREMDWGSRRPPGI